MSETLIPRSSLQAKVVDRLRAEIIDGIWRPGMRLQERLLCERYGISRSPLREAYQVLIGEGLIEVTPNRGAIVTAPTPSSILQNFELLRALELLAVRLACKNVTPERLARIEKLDREMRRTMAKGDLMKFLSLNNDVHREIVLAAENIPLADAHLIASRQIIRVQNLNGPMEHVADEGLHEHEDIIAAVTARDPERAVILFGRHLDTVEDNLRRRLAEFELAA